MPTCSTKTWRLGMSRVETMRSLFNSAAFNQNMISWNTSSVTDLRFILHNVSQLNNDILVGILAASPQWTDCSNWRLHLTGTSLHGMYPTLRTCGSLSRSDLVRSRYQQLGCVTCLENGSNLTSGSVVSVRPFELGRFSCEEHGSNVLWGYLL